MTTNSRSTDYKSWTREQLIERLQVLEGPRPVNAPRPSPPATAAETQDIWHENPSLQKLPAKEFNFASYPKRKIALKFCYSGWEYSGLAYQRTVTPLPTVEGVLFDAMAKARLVDSSGGLEGCGWEKCGRTDRGVSAAGQVISLWVRSALGLIEGGEIREEREEEANALERRPEDEGRGAADFPGDFGLPGIGEADFGTLGLSNEPRSSPNSRSSVQSKPKNELDYITVLNRLLPPTIRVLAWAPVSSTFSARFSCKYRHYKYFFSSHHLSIPAMREATSRLVGEHDFRNLCKLDAQKQITSFRRNISRADIELVDIGLWERNEEMYVFNLVGSAFLYHQVRHIMSVLFMVGTGLEQPSLVTHLLNVSDNAESALDGEKLEVVDRRPHYQMADALPLMLWECGYAEEDVEWRSSSLEPPFSFDLDQDSPRDTRRSGRGTEATDLYYQLHSIWNRSRVHTTLDRHFLQAAEQHHRPPPSVLPLPIPAPDTKPIQEHGWPIIYPLGGGTYKRDLKYVPVLRRNRLETVETMNERWRFGKGKRRAEKKGENENGDGGDE